MTTFDVKWSNYKLQKEYTIGILIHDRGYIFKYDLEQVYEAINDGFRPFVEFPDIRETYTSQELFSTFAIRLQSATPDEIDLRLAEGALLATDRVKVYCRGANNDEEN